MTIAALQFERYRVDALVASFTASDPQGRFEAIRHPHCWGFWIVSISDADGRFLGYL